MTNIDQFTLIALCPPGKTGWPWTEATPPLPPTLPDGSPWPKISIVTPSFNQAQYLEETIRSVLLQGYPNLEYIIIDGGSTDGSVEIIKKYEPWLAYWVSEKDWGQSHAINKGFDHSTGEIMAWINSDDFYAAGAFQKITKTFSNQKTLWIAGLCNILSPNGESKIRGGRARKQIERWFIATLVQQPGVFWKKRLWEQTKKIDETLHYSFDYELWFQFVCVQPFPVWVNQVIANFRIHSESKTFLMRENFQKEDQIIHERYRFLISLPHQKIIINALKEEPKSNKLLAELKSNNLLGKLMIVLQVLIITPWYLFHKSFYSRLKAAFEKDVSN